MESVKDKFSKPHRQAGIAIVIILIKFFKTTIKALWPVALSFYFGRNSGGSWQDYVLVFVLAFAAFNLGGSILTYFRFYIQLHEDSVTIDKGILKRSKTKIPFERIQSINFKQNLVHQFFGVVSVEIDTAGAKKAEMTIDALQQEDAAAFRDFIMEAKAKLQPTEETILDEEQSDNPSPEQTILHLSVSDLFKIGISQNHLRSMGILFGFVFTILNDLTENIGDFVEDRVEDYEPFLGENQWFIILASAIFVAIISFIYSLIVTTLKHYDLKLKLNQNGLKLIMGLFNREEISINKNKIQKISWSDNPLRRVFKMWTVSLEQASSDDASTLQSKIKVPGCYQKQVEKVIDSIFPKAKTYAYSKHSVSHLLRLRLLIFVSIIPFIIAAIPTFIYAEWQALWLIIWPVFTAFYIELYFRKRSFEISTEIFKSNGGAFGNHIEITQVHKIQAVEIYQSWYQRRKNIANLELFTAAGSLKVPFIPLEKALALEKYILYRIETDKREWM